MADGMGQATAAVAEALAPLLGERLVRGASRLAEYAQAEGHHRHPAPELAAIPVSVEEVQAVVRACAGAGCAIVPFGAGTSLEGAASTPSGALCLDLRRLDRICGVSAGDMACTVEPGVTRERLNDELRATGLFFPVDPGADATLGGMISTRASGTNAVRYGTMRENVLALSVVLPSGELIRTGSRARKSSAGYDLTHLFVGAEGTLGIVVEAVIRLHARPEAVLAAVCPFATLDGAVATVTEAMQLGIGVARIELLDVAAMRAVNAYARLNYPEAPTLFVEFHGSAAGVAEGYEAFAAAAASHGVGETMFERNTDGRARLWAARHAALPAARALIPGSVAWVSDVCVPISALSAAITEARELIDRAGLVAPILGHVGDGNFHVFFILRRDDDEAWARAARVNETIIASALAAGGTCTGEHGIGIGKRRALLLEHGAGAVETMRRIKEAIDPGDILNPGKIFMKEPALVGVPACSFP